MKIKRQEKPKEEVITIEHEGDEITFTFKPVIKTDFFFLAQKNDFESLAKWILSNKLEKLEGVTYEDGSKVSASSAIDLPLAILFEVVGKYSERIKDISEEMAGKHSEEKKTEKES